MPHSGLQACPGAPTVPAQGVFLHTAWRSGGTWLWSRLRESGRTRAFYEPLHEQMATLRMSDIGALRPQSWHSNHSDTPPYFEEYRDLLRPVGRGVDLYRPRFALHDFFMSPDDDDAELEAYVDGLVGSAAAAGKMAVLKFCRSLGRVGWFERRFPACLHAVVLRDPVSQWRSSRRLLTEQRNRYFVVAPILVLARNARHPLVRDATTALGVRLPSLHSNDVAYGVETVWRHVKRLDDDQLYRGFLAFWTACAVSALQSTALVIDSGAIDSDAPHRSAVEAALQTSLGERVALAPHVTPASPPSVGSDQADANFAAAELVRGASDGLSTDRMDTVLGMLGAGWRRGSMRAVRGVALPAAERAQKPRRNALQSLATEVSVVLARAIQPVRRLHGRVMQRIGG